MTPERTEFQGMPPKWLPPNRSEERFARKVMIFLNLSRSDKPAKRRQELLITFYREAVAEERERCARIALGLDSVDRGELTMDDWEHSLQSQTALNIAAAIRGGAP